VEKDPAALSAIRANLARTRLGDRASVRASDVRRFLKKTSNSGRAVDLCFLDPPYRTSSTELSGALQLLQARLSSAGCTIVLTRGVRSSMPVIPVNWRVARRLEYGDTLVIIYREV